MENAEIKEEQENKSSNKKKEWLQAFKYLCFAASAGLIQVGSDALMFSVFHWAE